MHAFNMYALYIGFFTGNEWWERERRSEKRFPYPKHSLINTSRNIWAQNFNLKTYHHGCVAGAAMLHAGCLYYGLRSAAIDVLGIKTMNHCWFSLGCWTDVETVPCKLVWNLEVAYHQRHDILSSMGFMTIMQYVGGLRLHPAIAVTFSHKLVTGVRTV